MLVALAGLLGCGKSTVAARLGQRLGAPTFCEPEEASYPQFVTQGDDAFVAHMWFRSSRVHNLHQAAQVSADGGVAVVDSIYDLLLHQYLGAQEFAWLMERSDPYFDLLADLARRDAMQLTAPDVVAFLAVDQPVWQQRLATRRRALDEADGIASAYGMQTHLLRACTALAATRGSHMVVIDTSALDVDAVVETVRNHLTALTPAAAAR